PTLAARLAAAFTARRSAAGRGPARRLLVQQLRQLVRPPGQLRGGLLDRLLAALLDRLLHGLDGLAHGRGVGRGELVLVLRERLLGRVDQGVGWVARLHLLAMALVLVR